MPCFSPLRAFQGADGSVFFVELKRSQAVRTLDLPCGRCVGCLLERSRQWAVRCMHEAQMHELSCFVTLTYEDDSVVSLDYSHFQKFLRSLRKRSGRKVRFFACGEYGEMNFRPHFHALLFGIDFTDKRVFSRRDEVVLYESKALQEVWGRGFCTIGDVTFQSAGYVARYCMKKLDRQVGVDMYRTIDRSTGEVISRELEMLHMSLKPGIGAGWLERFQSDVYPRGYVVVNGQKAKPPRYYDKKYKCLDPQTFEDRILYERELRGIEHAADNTNERLAVRDQVQRAAISFLKRDV
nr:MAG: replication initiator protein [Microvirus sp.]